MEVKDKIVKVALKVLPYKMIRHYLYPLMVRGEKTAYSPQQFWNSYFESARNAEFSDGVTVAHNYDPLTSLYHYHLLENTIIQFIMDHKINIKDIEVIDIGSGAGHWINFYHELISPKRIIGFELSVPGVQQLKEKFQDRKKCIKVFQQDISSSQFNHKLQVDIVNAIGVMFHIVEDNLWEQALRNIANCLKPGGYFLVGGQFGHISQNVQFHNKDSFANWDQYTSYVSLGELFKIKSNDTVLVNKKIRSIYKWKRAGKKVGLNYVGIYRNKNPKNFIIPENNLLLLQKQS